VLGVVWLAVIAWILVSGSTHGLVAAVSVSDTVEWLEVVR
jgi:hypothetical protein